MKKLIGLIGGLGCLALQACSAGTDEGDFVGETTYFEQDGLTGTMTLRDWGGVYCADFALQNGLAINATKLGLVVEVPHGSIQPGGNNGKNVWGMTTGQSNGMVSFSQSSGFNLPSNWTHYAGFCVNTAPGQPRPTLKVWNMGSNNYAPCATNSGLNPMRAALAVAMGAELRRWKPEVDLQKGWDGKVSLSSTGLARCTNGCPNTKAILGQQDEGIRNFVDQNVFNPTVFMEDMKASFDRVKNKMDDLARNNPGALPVDHNLTLVGGPVNLGLGACGPHYIYQVTHANGSELTTSQAQNLSNALCFYGQGSCGANPYIGYVSSNIPGCPYGKKCVAIDPTDGDTSSTNTTTAGSAPTYPMNRVWNPDNSLLGTSCMTTTGKAGTLQSKCSSYPATCGYLYCIAP
jgi:hypothetical protein